MADCKQEVKKVAYNEESLAKPIIAYNKCSGTTYFEPKSTIAKLLLRKEVLIGSDRGAVSLHGLQKFAYVRSYSMPIGLGIRVNAPRFNDKIFAGVHLFYDKKVYQVYDERTVNNAIERSDYLVKFSYLKLAVNVQYNFLNKESSPYIKGGYIKYAVFDLSGTVVAEIDRNKIVEPDLTKYIYSIRNPYGLWFGGGYQYGIGKGKNIFAEIRYDFNNGFTYPRPASKSKGNNLAIFVGFNF
jgi:hypothetical protein